MQIKNSDLVAKELIQVAQLVGVGDLAVEGCIPLLLDTCGAADLDGGVAPDAARLARRLT